MIRPARHALAPLALAAALLGPPPPARAHEGCDGAHAQHMESMKRARRSTASYTVPAVDLVRDDGKTVSLPAELDDGHPVVVEFVFTTCTTICPIMSRTLALLQDRLGGARDRVHLLSISIDPEEDTPARLAAYARKLGAGPEWHFYTGTTAASEAVQRAFDAYRGDKMSHTPLTFVRTAPGRRWVRIDGFATADELARELRAVVASR